MSKYSKFNMIYQLQKWMDSVSGQTFLNYAYSWGASIVILGTLFKLTHLPGANFFLFLGMGTEVLVFFISAFDRPFDKTADGMDLHTNGSREAGVLHDMTDEEFEVPSDMQEQYQQPEHTPVSVEEVRQQLGRQLENVNALSPYLPNDKDSEDLKSRIKALHEVYGEMLLKASSQLSTLDTVDKEFKLTATYLTEINGIYSRMLEAIKVPQKGV